MHPPKSKVKKLLRAFHHLLLTQPWNPDLKLSTPIGRRFGIQSTLMWPNRNARWKPTSGWGKQKHMKLQETDRILKTPGTGRFVLRSATPRHSKQGELRPVFPVEVNIREDIPPLSLRVQHGRMQKRCASTGSIPRNTHFKGEKLLTSTSSAAHEGSQ